MICYGRATMDDLESVWAYNIAQNPDEPRNQRWKESYIRRNRENRAATYVVVVDDVPVGEVTLDYHGESYGNPDSRKHLANGKQTGYVTALRIRKEFEGNGYISGLMQYMEDSAWEIGFTQLTIGVDAAESRNLAIYLHWGYNRFVLGEMDDGELVLFYAKAL